MQNFQFKKSGEVVTAQLKPNDRVSGGMADIKGPRQDRRSVSKAKALKLKWEQLSQPLTGINTGNYK